MKQIKEKNIKWWIGVISFMILFLGIGTFAFLKMEFIWKGVEVQAQIQKDETSLAKIKGNAKNATYITLNGREIFIDKNGEFEEVIALLPGFSVIKIDAKDKFGNFDEKKFEIVRKGEQSEFALVD
jgi:hypothetical protein